MQEMPLNHQFSFIKKTMVRSRYNRIPHLAQDTKRERNINTEDSFNYKTAQAEIEEDCSFPAYDHQTILNKAKGQRQTESGRTKRLNQMEAPHLSGQ